MLDLLWLAVTNLLVPLILWSAVFVLVAIAVALPVARWCVIKIRRTPPDGRLSSTRRWLLKAWIIVVLFIVPIGIALFHAVPFAASRGLAQLIEQSEPDATQWVAELVAENGEALGLDSEQIKSWTSSGSSYLVHDFALSLHLAAWGQLVSAIAFLAACHAATILLFRFAVRPQISLPPPNVLVF